MKRDRRHFTIRQRRAKALRHLKCDVGRHPHKKARNGKEFLARKAKIEAKKASRTIPPADPEEDIYFTRAL